MFAGARILVAPLDWGLGHAARCVPVVQALLDHGAVPVIGADKGPLALLHEAFPQVEHMRIPGMDVRYAAGRTQAWALARQFPAMLRQVRQEESWLEEHRGRLQLDAVISDQRFGLLTPALPSVLITHQLFPFTPVLQGLARRINRRHILRFDRCWIPDHAASPGLAGALSHGFDLPRNSRYIGPLSRFQDLVSDGAARAFRVVAVISGPEPQRSLFERELLRQLQHIEGPHLLVTGQPEATERQHGHVQLTGHLPTATLHAALEQAGLIVARTGYSTLMDLEAMGRGALLVPTPGQPEQEYLGRLHGTRGMHLVHAQPHVDIASALARPPERHNPCKSSPARSTALHDLAGMIARRSTRPAFRP